MLSNYKDELICDFAETYGIYDIYKFSGRYISTLAVGLRPDSRIKMKISGSKADAYTLLMAQILDGVNLFCWLNSADGEKGRNRPQSMFNLITGAEKKNAVKGFKTSEEFMAAWQGDNEV